MFVVVNGEACPVDCCNFSTLTEGRNGKGKTRQEYVDEMKGGRMYVVITRLVNRREEIFKPLASGFRSKRRSVIEIKELLLLICRTVVNIYMEST